MRKGIAMESSDCCSVCNSLCLERQRGCWLCGQKVLHSRGNAPDTGTRLFPGSFICLDVIRTGFRTRKPNSGSDSKRGSHCQQQRAAQTGRNMWEVGGSLFHNPCTTRGPEVRGPRNPCCPCMLYLHAKRSFKILEYCRKIL